jgi:hypothetical protein
MRWPTPLVSPRSPSKLMTSDLLTSKHQGEPVDPLKSTSRQQGDVISYGESLPAEGSPLPERCPLPCTMLAVKRDYIHQQCKV